jgi:hypothetical protein
MRLAEWRWSNRIDLVVTEEQIERILAIAINKVVNVVARNRIACIGSHTGHCSFAGARVVSLESTGAGVLVADCVGIIGPDYMEQPQPISVDSYQHTLTDSLTH